MNEQAALEKAKTELARWRILAILNVGRPHPVNENLILQTLNDAEIELTPSRLRRELDYLRDLKVINLHGETTPDWSADLTAKGVDIVEYTVDCPPGIARPRMW